MQNINADLVLVVEPSTQFDCKTEEEYVDKIREFLVKVEPCMKENSVLALSGFYGEKDFSNKVNACWRSVLESITSTQFSIGDVIVWKRNVEIKSEREDRLSNVCEPVFVLCRKNEYRTYHLNINEKTKKGTAVYHTPIRNLIETNGFTEEEDLKHIEEELIKLYVPKDGIVYRPFKKEGDK